MTPESYRGFKLYVTALDIVATNNGSNLRSGGDASQWGFQTINGVATQLRRSGAVEIEEKGNYNSLGWLVSTADNDWWQAMALADVPGDLYSIALHEMGHALFAHTFYPNWPQSTSANILTSPKIVAYHGNGIPVAVDVAHTNVVDRLSLKAAFGYNYSLSPSQTPYGRWLVTKLDLLMAEAVGHRLRATSAFESLGFVEAASTRGVRNSAYRSVFTAKGGLPAYFWDISTGSLPPGLSLNSFTGELTGTPTTLGIFSFTLRLRDADLQTAALTRSLTMRVGTNPLSITQITKLVAGMRVRFTTDTGVNYTVESSTNLQGPWMAVSGSLAGTGAVVSFTDPAPIVTRKFYRVVERW